MTLSPEAQYWDRGVDLVPMMTGALAVMDATDVESIAGELGIALPFRNVLDIGCGTGRASKHCDGYMGVDIAPSMVEFCRRRSLKADVITGPADLDRGPFDWVLCLSVFTHISREERQAYLAAFARRAPNLLVDIIPGDGTGSVAMWTAQEEGFIQDAVKAGFDVKGCCDRTSDTGVRHRYFLAEWAL